MFYDLTGVDPDYKINDHRFMVFEAGQIIELNQPVFADSIEVQAILPGGAVIMPTPTDWDFTLESDDDMAMSEGKLVDENFGDPTERLVKSIQITRAFLGQYQIGVTYQKFRSSLLDDAIREGVPAEYDPNLLANLVQTVRYLQTVAGMGSAVVTGIGVVDHLHEDRTGLDPTNAITGESFAVDVNAGTNILKPARGSFFGHDVVVRLDNGTPLTPEADYIIMGADLPRTRMAEHPSGVFKYIYLIYPVVGEVTMDYHAYGGEITEMDFEELNAMVIKLAHQMAISSYVTTESLPDHEYIIDLNRRTTELEDWRRAMDFTVPKYEFTTGLGVNEIRWYNVGHLYKKKIDDGHIYFQGSMNIRLKFRSTEYISDGTVTIDMNHPNKKLDCKLTTSVGHEDMFNVKNISDLPVVPLLRIVAVNNPVVGQPTNFDTGVMIQLGVHGSIADDIHVEHHSSISSEIFLCEDTDPTPTVKNDIILMPDGIAVWDSSDSNAYSEYLALAPDDGALIWRGSRILSSDYSINTQLRGMLRSEYFTEDIFREIILIVHDRCNSRKNKLSVNVFPRANGAAISTEYGIVDVVDGAIVRCSVDTMNSFIDIWINSDAGEYSKSNNRFVLEQVLIK